MNNENKQLLKKSFKQSLKVSFGIAFWSVFGFIILLAGLSKGIGLAIVLTILFGSGYFICVKVTKFFIRKGRQDAEHRQNQSIKGIN